MKKNKLLPQNLERHQRMASSELAVDETIFSQSNGILGVRACFAEGTGKASDDPYALINGFYNTIPYHYEENSIHFPQEGQTIVKLMDTTSITFKTNQGFLNLSEAKLVDLKRTYVLSQGLTLREATYQLKNRNKIILREERIVSQSKKYLVISHIEIESVDYEGPIEITSMMKMPLVTNTVHNDPRVAQEKKHLNFVSSLVEKNYASMTAESEVTKMSIETAMVHDETFVYSLTDQTVIAKKTLQLTAKKIKRFTKFQIYNSLFTNPKNETLKEILDQLGDYNSNKQAQIDWADDFWEKNQMGLSEAESLLALQYNVYQLNSSGGENEMIQIAAKGISGVGYEGHYFWDTEIYMLPYFIMTAPEKAKRLLMFRYHHLEQAREEARKLGISVGIKIPWRTINGTETSPYYPAGSAQIHINSDLAYVIMQYYYATQDEDFMIQYGFELVLETALFILEYGVFKDNVFHINTVTGPDEYTALVNDNFYTNSMAKRHFENVVAYAMSHQNEVRSVFKKIGMTLSILDQLSLAASQMNLIQDETLKIVAQDESFLSKKNINLDSIPSDKHPLLLHYHPLFIYRHQLLKQSDAVLAMVLLNLNRDDYYHNSFYYYLNRTTHDSSLSKCMYGIAAYGLGRSDLGKEFLMDSLHIDLKDTKRHTQHGLHMANMGGGYLLLAYGLLGIRLERILKIAPVYQDYFTEVSLKFRYQGCVLSVEVKENKVEVTSDKPILIQLFDKQVLVDTSTQALIKSA
jgi:alpha,alpha-trehalose phosphorylase